MGTKRLWLDSLPTRGHGPLKARFLKSMSRKNRAWRLFLSAATKGSFPTHYAQAPYPADVKSRRPKKQVCALELS